MTWASESACWASVWTACSMRFWRVSFVGRNSFWSRDVKSSSVTASAALVASFLHRVFVLPNRRVIHQAELASALDDADLVVVENLCSLPLNPPAAAAVADILRGRRAVLHHHDLPWQRARFAGAPPPPDDPAWLHVTINDLSRRQLADRGIGALALSLLSTAPHRGAAAGRSNP